MKMQRWWKRISGACAATIVAASILPGFFMRELKGHSPGEQDAKDVAAYTEMPDAAAAAKPGTPNDQAATMP